MNKVLGAVIDGVFEMKPVFGSILLERVTAFEADRIDRVANLQLVIRL